MYAAIIDGRAAFCALTRVSTLSDIEFLVKEAEMLTGKPGRIFLVGGTAAYSIQLEFVGYTAKKLDGQDQARCTHLFLEELEAHALGTALREGRLFTPLLGT